ncbi:MAG: hypothetical protein ABI864_05540 [Chloroflexota bacterium]
MKRRREQERDDAMAREQADARREALLAELKAHEAAVREPEPPTVEPGAESVADEPAAEAAAEPEPAEAPESGEAP